MTRAKAQNGEGTPRKVLIHGVWKWQSQLPVYDRNGVLVRRISHSNVDLKVVQAWRDKTKRELAAANGTRAKPTTVPEVVQQWLVKCRGRKTESTMRQYETVLRRHIKRALNIRADKVDDIKLEAFFRDVMATAAAGGGSGKHGLCAYELARSVLSASFRWASRPAIGLMDHNPLAGFEFDPGVERKPVTDIPVEDVEKLLEAAKGKPTRLLWLLLLRTGGRRGEITGLNVEDIDLKGRRFDINKIASPESNGRLLSSRTKGKKARWVPLAADVLGPLEDHIRGSRPGTPLFTSPRGGRLASSTYDDWWHRDLKAAGLDGQYTGHQLRHTFATWALRDQKQSVNVVSKILGHASTAITLQVYGHVMDDQRIGAVDAVASFHAQAVANKSANESTTLPSIPVLAPDTELSA